jgi:ABC-2 type transport system ATP-binding protein
MTTAAHPSAGSRIEVSGLTKHFGPVLAVDHLDFTVEPGRVTGFLGPNGAGKTTTLRMLLGLVRPNAGTATIGGRRYHDLSYPLKTVGSALEATNFHPGRSGRDHLRVLADAAGLPLSRCDELLELVGLAAAARQRAGGYSMGMRQRLGLAAALLGDPQVLILDEPANGLDPEGIRWLRGLLRYLAGQGKTVLISSHLLTEVEQTVDDVVIIASGRSMAQGSIASLRGEPSVLVRTTDLDQLGSTLTAAGLLWERTDPGTLTVKTPDLATVGDLALRAGLPVHELRALASDLEDLFFRLTEPAEQRPPGVSGSSAVGPAGPPEATSLAPQGRTAP